MSTYRQSFTLHVDDKWMRLIRLGQARATQNKSGVVTRIYVPVTHLKLNLFKEISGADRYTLQQKLNELLISWDKKYSAQVLKQDRDAGKELAAELVADAEQKQFEIGNILKQTLGVDDTVDWGSLKSSFVYEAQAFQTKMPLKPPAPNNPQLTLPKYLPPSVTFFQKLFGKAKEIEAAEQLRHQERCKIATDDHAKQLAALEARVAEINAEHEVAVMRWQSQKSEWEKEQQGLVNASIAEMTEHNESIDVLEGKWLNGTQDAVIEHATLVLDASRYPDWFQGSFRVDYEPDTKLLKVEYMLPGPAVAEIAKSARFVATTGEIKTTLVSATEQKRLYDTLCYQVALRTVHELFEADTPANLSNVLFNGVVRNTDPATGIEQDLTIMSALFERGKFLEINLAAVDPKACFKSFNGVSAASLSGLAAIAPVIEFDTSDRRFIEGREVASGMSEGLNVAAMSWDDFEHLVREIFEKEFASRGGEVKVTQASSDGGVDAVAFDPDPISGGKIVIQAKRYTKTVGVAAVRDLYGTVLNEGASKGILVTTADYGPDAYKFAANKPITLLNGANLLHMLSQHGVKARIDLKEARHELGLAGGARG